MNVERKEKQKGHWCSTYRDLQREYSRARNEWLYPRGIPSANGYGGTSCDNENLLGGASDVFHGSAISLREVDQLSQNEERASLALSEHREECHVCIEHFGRS